MAAMGRGRPPRPWTKLGGRYAHTSISTTRSSSTAFNSTLCFSGEGSALFTTSPAKASPKPKHSVTNGGSALLCRELLVSHFIMTSREFQVWGGEQVSSQAWGGVAWGCECGGAPPWIWQV